MRIIGTTLLMLIGGFFASGTVAQAIVLDARADAEFILVYMAVGGFFILSSVAFLIAQFGGDVRRAAALAAGLLLVLIFAAAGILIVIDLIDTPEHGAIANNWPIIAGLTLPQAVNVLVQWLVVRWRNPAKPVAPIFGRGPRPA